MRRHRWSDRRDARMPLDPRFRAIFDTPEGAGFCADRCSSPGPGAEPPRPGLRVGAGGLSGRPALSGRRAAGGRHPAMGRCSCVRSLIRDCRPPARVQPEPGRRRCMTHQVADVGVGTGAGVSRRAAGEDTRVVELSCGVPVRAVDSVDLTSGWSQDERDYLDLDGHWRFTLRPGDVGTSDRWSSGSFGQRPLAGCGGSRCHGICTARPGLAPTTAAAMRTGTAFRDGYAWSGGSTRPAPGRPVRQGLFLGVKLRRVHLPRWHACRRTGPPRPRLRDGRQCGHPAGARNLLAVRVYRRPWYRPGATGPEAISGGTELPHKPVDYWPYAGITRGVFIEATAQVTVSKLITSARHGRLAVAAAVFNHGDRPPAAA